MSEEVTEETKSKKRRSKMPKANSLIIGVLLIGAVGFGVWQFQENQDLKTPEGQQQLSQAQINDTIGQVKKLLIIPEDEQPVIATVNDPEALKKDQPFYKDAQKGDQVLVYQKNQRAIIYSPARNVIVNVGGVSINGTPESTEVKPQ